ncbi:MAG: hypothetical protein LBG72_06285 [Spirochaetaceae bacterium]|jgi:hypothetical protein|nr:hypothetical protein [Spirochaetaceae bacterium]
MSTNLLHIVKQITARYGEAVLADPARLKAFFGDLAKDEPKPLRLAFGRCIEEGAYNALKTAPDAAERAERKAAIAQRLRDEHGLDPALCAEALDVLEAAMYGTAPAAIIPAKKHILRNVLIAAALLLIIAAGLLMARPYLQPVWMRYSGKPGAKVILARCSKTRQTFGIRIEERGGDWVRTMAFPVDGRKAEAEGFDTETISGSMNAVDEYPGCPHCGSKGFAKHSCGKLSCTGSEIENNDGDFEMTCPWCGELSIYTFVSEFEVSGGSDSLGGSSFADN